MKKSISASASDAVTVADLAILYLRRGNVGDC